MARIVNAEFSTCLAIQRFFLISSHRHRSVVATPLPPLLGRVAAPSKGKALESAVRGDGLINTHGSILQTSLSRRPTRIACPSSLQAAAIRCDDSPCTVVGHTCTIAPQAPSPVPKPQRHGSIAEWRFHSCLKMLARSAAAGVLIGVSISLIIALFIAMKPQSFARQL